MLDFDYSIPTEVYFGTNKIQRIAKEIKKYGNRILFVYGQGSINKIGLYDEIVKILNDNGIIYEELSGVKPNPRIDSVRKGIEICKQNNLEFILAVGGGSVIDCAKAISAGFYYKGDPWDIFLRKAHVLESLPLGSVLTLAATGSEMNGNSVVSNTDTKQKLVISSDLLRPKFSVLDPNYTLSVPNNQTAAGVVDIFSHIIEQYFSPVKEAFLQDRMAEGILKTCIKYGPIALKEPENYEARANLLWAGSLALNGLLSYGKIGDWATHYIEHEVSAIYDVTHGVGLAILTPHWMEYVLNDSTAYKFKEYSRNVWGVEVSNPIMVSKEGINKTKEFFNSLGMPSTLQEIGVEEGSLKEMAKKAATFGELGSFQKLNKDDILSILKNAF